MLKLSLLIVASLIFTLSLITVIAQRQLAKEAAAAKRPNCTVVGLLQGKADCPRT